MIIPSESVRVPGLPYDRQATVDRLFTRLRQVQGHNAKRERLYTMSESAPQIVKALPPQYASFGWSLGWIARGVDGLTNRTRHRGFSHGDADLDALGLRELVEDNLLSTEFAMARTESAICGPSYLVNHAGGPGEPASLVHARSANEATGDYDRRLRRMRNLLSVLDVDANGRPVSFALYEDGVTTVCARDVSGWGVVDVVEHPWGVPVEVMRYRPTYARPFGSSRITPAAIMHQRAAVRTLMRLEGHSDIHSQPELWLLGADSTIFGDNPRMDAMLGRIKGVPDDDDAENPRAELVRFEASAPDAHLKVLTAQAKLIAREFTMPDSTFALSDYANPTSADAFVEGREELLCDAETAMAEWGVAQARSVRRGLAMAHGDPSMFDALRGLRTEWYSPLHISKAAEADAGAKVVGSLPEDLRGTTVALRRLGFSDEEIATMRSEARALRGAAGLASRVAAVATGK